jgi:hypothetical protein
MERGYNIALEYLLGSRPIRRFRVDSLIRLSAALRAPLFLT